MPVDTPVLLDALNAVTAIPIVPYKEGHIDYDGHARNIRYLMDNNHQDNGRKRVIAIAGNRRIDESKSIR